MNIKTIENTEFLGITDIEELLNVASEIKPARPTMKRGERIGTKWVPKEKAKKEKRDHNKGG